MMEEMLEAAGGWSCRPNQNQCLIILPTFPTLIKRDSCLSVSFLSTIFLSTTVSNLGHGVESDSNSCGAQV